jgi:outer membrane protein assembly factor BamA
VKAARKVAKKDGKGKDPKTTNGHPPGGKFPSKPGKGQSNRCTVDGSQYYFHFKSNRWLLVDKQANISANGSATGTTASFKQAYNSGGSNQAAHVAERNLLISSITNQFADAMTSLSASMTDNS